MLDKESQLLSKVHFPLRAKQTGILGGSSNDNHFTPLSWYAEKPCEDDQLYGCLKMVMPLVNEGIQLIEERYSQERKENAGHGTLYLTLLPDESRLNFTIDQVLAPYLIDMSDLIKSN